MADNVDDLATLADLRKYVRRNLFMETIWIKLWSFLHHGSLFGGAVLSAAAALVLQVKHITLYNSINETNRSDVATVLASLGSVLGIISVAGAFATKWRANRATRGTLENIKLDLMKTTVDRDAIIDRLKEMWNLHNSRVADEPDRTISGERPGHDTHK
ncbi:hypothetical protein [Paraburkholderia sp. C35]|uniref:hypothetical protein n=1 Tax=Paraburkholderia sp. C35 TaxID=2126993 RepID=UPI000D698886|nr:hypothetical protein [Paraburkholderia sp. C35]